MHNAIPVFSASFRVVIDGVTTDEETPEYFSSVEGLGKYLSKNSHISSPGGEKGDVTFPTAYGTKKLVMARPLMNYSSQITKWCYKALDSFAYEPRSIYIFVMDVENNVVAQWTAHEAYPLSIDVSAVSMEVGNSIIEQTIAIKYNNLTMDKP